MTSDHNNLSDCQPIAALTPNELAGAIRVLASKIHKPVGVGIWEGALEGQLSGVRREGEHIAVFQEQALVAPFGPRAIPKAKPVRFSSP